MRSKLQVQGTTPLLIKQYNGIFDTIVKVSRTEGIRGLYRGLGSNLMRQCPSYAITFTCYELTSKALKSLYL